MSPLFRPEHVQYFKALHAIHIPRPMRVLALCIIWCLVILALFLTFVPWVQTAYGDGVVTAFHPSDRPQNISAPVKGRIKEWHVHEGQSVQKGDPLVEIIDNDPRYIERLELDLDATLKRAEVARAAAETAKLDFVRKEALFAQGLSSKHDLEKAKINYNEYLSKQASADSELAKMQTNRSRQDTQLVRAPDDGMIINMRSGDAATFVKEGDVVAQFIPHLAVQAVEIYVRGMDAPLIKAGAKVRLQFEGWPAVQFSGWPSVSIGSFGGIVKTKDAAVSANGKFRVLVVRDPEEAWPDEHFLYFGARARGWVLLNTVQMGFEVWRQLNGFPPLPPAGTKPNFLSRNTSTPADGEDDK